MSEMKGNRCDYCDHESECCRSTFNGFSCTRPEGHDGEHKACGIKHPIVSWVDKQITYDKEDENNMTETQHKDGGPAFPTRGFEQGMFLRDWFAGQALAGMDFSNYHEPGDMAMDAYAIADYMLKVKN